MTKRKNKRKQKRRNRKKTPKIIKPDDFFEIPGGTISRYGRFIHFQNNRTSEQQEQLDSCLCEAYPKIVLDIEKNVIRIQELVSRYDPLKLMGLSYWAFLKKVLGKKAEHEYGFEEIIHARMLDYIQAIIISSPPSSEKKEITEDLWQEIYTEVSNLYKTIYSCFFAANSARLKASQPDYDINYDAFCVEAQMYALGIRGKRHETHDWEFFEDFLCPHDGELQKLFGILSKDLIEGLKNISYSLTEDSLGAFYDLFDEFEKTMEALEASGSDDLSKLMEERSKDSQIRNHLESIAGRLSGLDLFDLEKLTSFPKCLLEELSLEPGQDNSFFKDGEYMGWPFRVFPNNFKPFLKVDGKYYCFDFINIMDNFYWAIRRIVCRQDSVYENKWKERQTEVSERRPIEILKEMLPGAKTYRSLYYPYKENEKAKTRWCELDGLLLCDDLLVAIEVKGGAFTWTQPIDDLPAYLDSIKNLLKKPAEQATRFFQYLRSGSEVAIYDENRSEIAMLSINQFRVILPVCVTLDSLTTAAYKTKFLKKIGIELPTPVWSLMLDDLRVYRDILPAGAIFAHYLEKRYDAERGLAVEVNDEFDHLGLYLAHLNYPKYIDDLSRKLNAPIKSWPGYRRKIDEFYYNKKCLPEEAEPPYPALSGRIREIIESINNKKNPGFVRCVAYLLDMRKEAQLDLEEGVKLSLKRGQKRGQASPVHIQGESSMTVFCHSPGIRTMSSIDRREYTFAWMKRLGLEHRLLLKIDFDSHEKIVNVDWEELDVKDIPKNDLDRIELLATQQVMRRKEAYLKEYGKIGRNTLCPCGSGKKFKKCCGH